MGLFPGLPDNFCIEATGREAFDLIQIIRAQPDANMCLWAENDPTNACNNPDHNVWTTRTRYVGAWGREVRRWEVCPGGNYVTIKASDICALTPKKKILLIF